MADTDWREDLRARARALQQLLEETVADLPLPPNVMEIVNRCREDLAIVEAATDEATAALLASGVVQSFEALRGLMRRH